MPVAVIGSGEGGWRDALNTVLHMPLVGPIGMGPAFFLFFGQLRWDDGSLCGFSAVGFGVRFKYVGGGHTAFFLLFRSFLK